MSMRPSLVIRWVPIAPWATCALLLFPDVARAHPMPGVGDFYAGMLHPIIAIEFLLSWITLASLIGRRDSVEVLVILGIFVGALATGAIAAQALPSPMWLSRVDFGLMTLGGLLVALAFAWPAAVLIVLSAMMGFAHGMANASEFSMATSAWRFIPGLIASGLVIVICGVGVVRSLHRPWTLVAVRVVGSWIAAVGIMLTALGWWRVPLQY
jgi:urease accessory protein